MVYKSIVKS